MTKIVFRLTGKVSTFRRAILGIDRSAAVIIENVTLVYNEAPVRSEPFTVYINFAAWLIFRARNANVFIMSDRASDTQITVII